MLFQMGKKFCNESRLKKKKKKVVFGTFRLAKLRKVFKKNQLKVPLLKAVTLLTLKLRVTVFHPS